MDISELSKYINVVVCGICFCMGIVFKNSCPFIPNSYIPLLVSVVGMFMNVWLNNWQITPEILLGGMISGLSSCGIWENYKNLFMPK